MFLHTPPSHPNQNFISNLQNPSQPSTLTFLSTLQTSHFNLPLNSYYFYLTSSPNPLQFSHSPPQFHFIQPFLQLPSHPPPSQAVYAAPCPPSTPPPAPPTQQSPTSTTRWWRWEGQTPSGLTNPHGMLTATPLFPSDLVVSQLTLFFFFSTFFQ